MAGHTNRTKYFFKEKNNICTTFDTLRRFFPDELNSGEYNFKASPSKKYCPNETCNNDIDKVNGYCLWLFNQLYNDKIDFSNNANYHMNIITYIFGWLSYKLNQKTQNGITKLSEFYNKYMENFNVYKKPIDGVTEYNNYIELINKNKELMDIDINVMSKFYDAFNNLCKMYNELSMTTNNKGEEYLKYVENFAKNYNDLIDENFNDTKDNLFKQVLYVALNDYNYIKSTLSEDSIRNRIPELPKEKKTQIPLSSNGGQLDEASTEMTESSSETEVSSSKIKVSGSETDVLILKPEVSESETILSSSLVKNKLIIVLPILVAIPIFLGISYKYSLFGFRKRAQKQYLREKIKK
ncbi:PIR protein [Plasmodium yoelii yoelii]|uniref:PIR protein n=1 Tax=Plasmodium yoelii yoelii TaxID=73239 RepID=A0AAE9WXI6_PLAYO|nr:PIR protein [Plasmodium yoelii yoelii]